MKHQGGKGLPRPLQTKSVWAQAPGPHVPQRPGESRVSVLEARSVPGSWPRPLSGPSCPKALSLWKCQESGCCQFLLACDPCWPWAWLLEQGHSSVPPDPKGGGALGFPGTRTVPFAAALLHACFCQGGPWGCHSPNSGAFGALVWLGLPGCPVLGYSMLRAASRGWRSRDFLKGPSRGGQHSLTRSSEMHCGPGEGWAEGGTHSRKDEHECQGPVTVKGSGQGGRNHGAHAAQVQRLQGSLGGAGLACRCRERREALAQGRGVERGTLGVLMVLCCCRRGWAGGRAHRVR